MTTSTSAVLPTKAFISGWERILLVLPALAGLVFGLFPLFLPTTFAAVSRFPADDLYLYQLAGAATLGYGVALSIGLFQKNWSAVRLPVIGVLVFNLGSLYACGVQIFSGPTPYSVSLILVSSVLFVAISGLLLFRHRGVPRQAPNLASTPLRIFLMVGAVSAAVFGILPLFAPGLFTIFHLHMTVPFLARQAGSASLGYAVMAILAQWALNTQELPLIGVAAGIFNGVSGIVSIPYILAGTILFLPWLIGPVGLLVLVGCFLVLRQTISLGRVKS
ncbi:MAG TPA: hypothetical protein VGF67_30650 [Ktedonobacteraceae bacterium]|jgi:hypothetical protein